MRHLPASPCLPRARSRAGRVVALPLAPLRAAGALASAVLCLVAQLAGVAHHALVTHVRCVEHDALVHTGSDGDANAASDAIAAARGRTTATPADSPAGHADDHCLSTGWRRREDWLPAPAVGADLHLVAAAPEPPPAFDETRPTPTVALLRLAPKSGPPAHA